MSRTEYIKNMIDEKWDSRTKFAKHIGIPPTTLQSILERGVGKASIDNVMKICRGLGITTDSLQFISDETTMKENGVVYDISKRNYYRYIPFSVSAGLPIEIDSITNYDTIAIADELLGKYAGNKNVYFMRVNGDSMNNLFPHNSLIAVLPQTVEDIKDGDIVVYSHNYDYSVKTFYRNQDELIFKSNSNNPMFHDYVFKINDVDLRIHGKVILYIVNVD
ncbi:LexA family protein [Metasolibacillus meyeri]|uniref:LexA family protein n=1 Tax=Metasolibacillus meyeri TaxID=1071052 RepID=UPI000D311249|nr:XRE family transcriptional regulator [Metasolibacillus meyeri]